MDTKIQLKAKEGTFWTVGINIFLVVGRIGITAITARLIKPEYFGMVATLMIIVEIAKISFSSFINKNLVLENSTKELSSAAFIVSLFHSFIIAIVLWYSANYLQSFFEVPNLVPLIKFGVILIILNSMVNYWVSHLEKSLDFKWLAKRKLAKSLLGTGIFTIVLAWYGLNEWALLGGLILAEIIDLILLVNKQSIKLVKPNYNHFKTVYKDAISITSTSFLNKIAQKGDYIIASKYLGAESLGLYEKGYKLMALPTNLVGAAIGKIGLASLADYQDDYSLQEKMFVRLLYLIALLLLPISVLIFYLADLLVLILLGPDWSETTPVLKVLAAGIFLRMAYKVPGTLLQAQRRFRITVFIQFVYAITVIVLSFVLKGFGIIGIAYAMLLALCLQFIILNYFVSGNININFAHYLQIFKRPVIISVLFILFMEIFISVSQYFFKLNDNYSALFGSILILIILSTLYLKFKSIVIGEMGIWWLNKLKK